MSTTLTIIGCRAGSPGGNSPASGYLLQAKGQNILIDCGSGVALRLAEMRMISQLDGVIVTHGHADHILDLIAITYHRLFPHALEPLPLIGPPSLQGTLELLDQTFGIPTLPSLARPLAKAFYFQPVPAGEIFELGGLRFNTFRGQHPVETLALRLPGLVYTSDTSISEELIDFAQGTQMLLADATYPDDTGHDLQEHGHMTGALAGELARRAGAIQLVLTHLAEFEDEEATLRAAKEQFLGKVIVAKPGLRLVLPAAAGRRTNPQVWQEPGAQSNLLAGED